MIPVTCGQCARENAVSPALAGLTLLCKGCGAKLSLLGGPVRPAAPVRSSTPPPDAVPVARVNPTPRPPAEPVPLARVAVADLAPPERLPPEIWATRWQRFLARLIDAGIALGAVYGSLYIGLGIGGFGSGILAFVWVPFLLFWLAQAWLLSTRGQNIGKVFVGIRIVRTDGGEARFWDAFLMREVVMLTANLVPVLGSILSLADHLLIFADDQRCLHDRIAGTRVIRVDTAPLPSGARPA